MKIGILAVQGDYEAHARMLARLGADYILVRTPQEAAQVDAMILPGGESTTMLKFLKEEGLEAALRALDARGVPFFGTCAGAILLAREVRAPAQESLGLADLVITRNAYGRQLSSEVRSAPSQLKAEPLEMVFIRAPWIEETGPGVEVLAREGGRPGARARRPHSGGYVSPRAHRRYHRARIFPEARRRPFIRRLLAARSPESEVDAHRAALLEPLVPASKSSSSPAPPRRPRPRF